jgi:type IV pilus assembly protein PilX
MKTLSQPIKQQGAALIVGLVLLVVITVLAISGMNTATTELAMARNDQNYEYAFQAAETGLETVMASGTFDTAGVAAVTKIINTNDSVLTQVDYEDSSIVPDKAFSLGSGSGVSAYHFVATATSKSERDPGSGGTDRDSAAVHTQAFYVVGPASPTP